MQRAVRRRRPRRRRAQLRAARRRALRRRAPVRRGEGGRLRPRGGRVRRRGPRRGRELARGRGRGARPPSCARASPGRPDPDDGRADRGRAGRRARAPTPTSRCGGRASPSSPPSAGRELGVRPRVHVKYDSGHGPPGRARPGRGPARWSSAVAADERLELAGLWTHFATADEPDSPFFDEQLERFGDARRAGARAITPGSSSTPPTAPPRCGTRLPTSTWSAAGSRSTASTRSRATPSSAASSRRSSCAPTSPTSSASPPATAPATGGAGGRPRTPGSGCCRSATATASGEGSPTTPRCWSAARRYPLVGTVSMDNVTVDLGPATRRRARAPRRC